MEPAAAFNTLDLAVVCILLLSGILAFMRGFVREAFSLGTWVGAGFASVRLYPIVKPWALQHIHSDIGAGLATGIGIFCAGLIILIPLSNLLAGLIKGESLTAIDRSLGFVFGLLRGILILSLLYLCTMIIWPVEDGKSTMPKLLAQAKTRPAMAFGAEMMGSLIPQDKAEKLAEEYEKGKKDAEDVAKSATGMDFLSTPVPASEKPKTKPDYPEDKPNKNTPAYRNEDRNKMNDLIEKKSQTP